MNLFVFQGGKPFVLTYQENLPDEVHSAWVLFGKTTYVEVRKLYENCFSGLKIPRMYIYFIVMYFYATIGKTVSSQSIHPYVIIALLMCLNTIAK